MPASKKTSSQQSSFFNRDLFIFIAIMAIVAIMTYFLTVSAITNKFSEQVGGYDNIKNTQEFELPNLK